MFISYAQNFEDIILWRALKHVERGFYIDIGAMDPVIDSVSLTFYEHGWRGVHVEPTNSYASKLRSARPDEEVIEAAVHVLEGSMPFFEIADTGISTGDETIAHEHELNGYRVRQTDVPCLPLSTILNAHTDRPVHWLKIDVEGMEKQVLESWLPSPVRPWVVVIESTKPGSPELTFSAWESQFDALGYEFVYFDGLNRFYLSAEHPELKGAFGQGPNFFDDFVLSGSQTFCHKVTVEAASLRREVSERTEEMERLTRSLESVRADAASLRHKVSERVEEVARLTRSLDSLRTEAAAREARLSARMTTELALKNDAIQAEVGRSAALTTALQESHEELAVVKAELEDSISIRWLRALVRKARFSKGVVRFLATFRSFSRSIRPLLRPTAAAERYIRRKIRGLRTPTAHAQTIVSSDDQQQPDKIDLSVQALRIFKVLKAATSNRSKS
jgi:FkbM family methyltransferase